MRRSIVIIVLLFSSACGNLSPCPDNSCQQPPRGKGLSEAHKVYYTATRKDGVGVLAALPRKDYNTWQLVDGMAWFVVDSNPVVYFDGVAELIDFSASLTGDERYVYRYTETTGFCRGASYVMMADRLDLAGKLEIRIRALSDECPTDLEEAIDCEALRAQETGLTPSPRATALDCLKARQAAVSGLTYTPNNAMQNSVPRGSIKK